MPISLILIELGVVVIGVFIIVNSKKPKRQQDAKRAEFYRKAYEFLSHFFLSQSNILKIYSKIAMLSIYSRQEIMELAAKYYIMSTGLSLGIVVLAFILFDDALSRLICILLSVMINTILIDKQLDKTTAKLYIALGKAISSIRQAYMKYGSIPEAINEAEYDPIIRRPMEEIYTILTTSNGELRLHEFYESTPFRSIQTLAGVCYNIHNSGDTIDSHGGSNFIQALTVLTGDINAEIERIVAQRQMFSKLEYLPLAPIIGIPLIESYFSSIIPGTALIYFGSSGYLYKTAILLSCIFAYVTIAKVNTIGAIKQDDRSPFISNLLRNKNFLNIVNNICPKGVRADRLEKKLKAALSKMSIKEFYAKKLFYGVMALAVGLVAIVCATYLGKEFVTTSTQQLSLVATDDLKGVSKDQIKALDKAYLNKDDWGDEELKALVKSYLPGLTDLQVLDQVKRLKDKKESIDNAYFKWWYTWIVYLAGVVGWFGPNILLYFRKYLVMTEAEDDFLQLQTLVSILMNTDIDLMDTLQQLSQHSRIHKDMLTYCYHSFPSDPYKELARLKSKTPLPDFKRFIGKLELCISDLSLKEAFGDLLIEREHTIKIRDMTMRATLKKKRQLCGILAMLPIALFVICELLLPIGILGINEFQKALESI